MTQAPTLFLGLELPAPVRRTLEPLLAALAALGPAVRVPAAEGLHLTLAYLGRVERGRLPGLVETVSQVALATDPFPVRLSGLGCFPSPDRARVVWIGLGEGEPELARLAGALRAALDRAGWELERRPFRAHCTLARLAGRPSAGETGALQELLRRPAPDQGTDLEARALALLESVRVPGAANSYPVRRSWPMGRG